MADSIAIEIKGKMSGGSFHLKSFSLIHSLIAYEEQILNIWQL